MAIALCMLAETAEVKAERSVLNAERDRRPAPGGLLMARHQSGIFLVATPRNGRRSATVPAGELPAWEVTDLPAPPAWDVLSILRVIGPGAILLGTSIGGGEWLVGPTAVVKYSLTILWVTLVAVVLQTLLNLEMIRYTIYTGEPIMTGLMRTKPGPTCWGWVYSVLTWFQCGWPALAGTAAGTLAAGVLGRLPNQAQDGTLVLWLSMAIFLSCAAVLVFGGKVERTLERLNWFMVAWILIYLVVVVALFVPVSSLLSAVRGLFSFGYFPKAEAAMPQLDWFLLAAFASSSGAGGAANAALTNWFRDKGFGMGAHVGYIPSLVGGREVKLSHTGKVFPITPENLKRWKHWWRFAKVDQYGVFLVGALLGMTLPAVLAVECLPQGKELRGLAVAAEIAHGLSRMSGHSLWILTLLCGFWILYSSQLGNMDILVRTVTDNLWTGSRRVRQWRGGDIRRVYYTLLAMNVVWGLVALQVTQPIFLFQLGANVAALTTALLSFHTLYVNRRFLPEPLRPPGWRQAALLLCGVFYTAFVFMGVRQLLS
jgi:hypothetical protein